MERKTRLYNTKTRRWEWWYIEDPVRKPWERLRLRLRWPLRYAGRFYRRMLVPRRGYDYDPEKMTFRDRRAERRRVRLARRAEVLVKAEHALTAMVQMQKFIR